MDGKRVLLIEGNDHIRAFVSTVLGLAGAHLTVCSTPETACEKLAPDEFDVILLGVNVPGVSTWGFLESAQRTAANCPIVMFTSHISAEDREKARAMGAVEFLSNPLGARELVQQLSSLLPAGQ